MATRQAAGIPTTRRSLGTQIRLTAAGALVALAVTAGIAAHQLSGNVQHGQRIAVATNPVAAGGDISRTASMGGAVEALAERAATNTSTLQVPRPGSSADSGEAQGAIALASLPTSAQTMGGYADWLSTRSTGSEIGTACDVAGNSFSATLAC